MTTSDLRRHIEAYWLRPESAIWDAIAAARIGPHLAGKPGLMEVGIGNGFFSFLMLGGAFTPDFDWFRSVGPDGFWSHADIFDHDAGVDIAKSVAAAPHTRIATALDHKATLLSQARRLGFIDRLIEHDANQPLPPDVAGHHAYSNMFYWLQAPIDAMHRVGERLPTGGSLVTVFPMPSFFDTCQSYRDPHPLWRLINRGRANHIRWHMDADTFRREIDARGLFAVESIERYLCPLVLRLWDIGLRPLSVPLIKMANTLSEADRLAIKAEWCDTVEKLAVPVLDEEAAHGARTGGFLLAVLRKC